MSLASHLIELKKKHAELDKQVSLLQRSPSACSCEISNLKKQKLKLKEEIAKYEAATPVDVDDTSGETQRELDETGSSMPGGGSVLTFEPRQEAEYEEAISEIAARVVDQVTAVRG